MNSLAEGIRKVWAKALLDESLSPMAIFSVERVMMARRTVRGKMRLRFFLYKPFDFGVEPGGKLHIRPQ